ncbi:MAG: Rrf2 family transcriptional regulator [Candidatus Marinimicrobia bacterium]|nr:Rrf2 family transcriptional regulator [Candidatus Neomarinimicrobiota bacterium]
MSKYNSFIKREYDYAIRIAAFLGSQYPDGYRSISDVSRLLMISHSITSKIAHKLQKTGILKSYRGRNGGIALAKDPNTISFYNILEAMGFNSTMNDCIVDPGICPLVDMCKVHLYFLNMEKDIHHSLKNTFTSSFLFKEDDLITARKKCLSLT